MTLIKTNLTAGQYNSQARDAGREDWNIAYRKDVLGLDDSVTNTTQKTNTVKTPTPVITSPIPGQITNTPDNDIALKTETTSKTNSVTNDNIKNDTSIAKDNNIAPTYKINGINYTEKQITDRLKSTLDSGKINQNQYKEGLLQFQKLKQENESNSKPITNIAEFKQAGGTLNNLENLIENKYGTIATIKGDKIRADINGTTYEWYIDNAGNPIKNSLGTTEQVSITESNIGKSSNDFFSSMVKGENLGNTKELEGNPDYISAKKRFNTYNTFDKSQIGIKNGIINGVFLKNPELYQDLIDNGYGEVINLAQVSVIKTNSEAEAKGEKVQNKSIAKMTVQETIDASISIDKQIHGDYEERVRKDYEENKIINQNKDDYNRDYAELVKLQKDKNDIYTKLKNTYPNASANFINAMYNKEVLAINGRINELSGEIASYENNVNTELNVLNSKYKVLGDVEKQKQDTFTNLLSYKNSAEQRASALDLQTKGFENDIKLQQAKFDNELIIESMKNTDIPLTSLNNSQIKTYTKLMSNLPDGLTADSKNEYSNFFKNGLINGGNYDNLSVAVKDDVKSNILGYDLKQALSVLSTKMTAEQSEKMNNTIDNIISTGGGIDEVRDTLISYAALSPNLTAEDRRSINDLPATLTKLSSIKEIISNTSDDEWRLLEAAKKRGYNFFRKQEDEDLTKLDVKTRALLQVYRKAMTGVAFGKQEASEYEDLFPRLGDSKELALSKVDTLYGELQTELDGTLGVAMGKSYYDSIFKGKNIGSATVSGGDEVVHTGIKDGSTYTRDDLLNATPGTSIPTRLNVVTSNNPGGAECAEYINDAFGLSLGDYYDQKVADMDIIKTQGWQTINADIGDVVVWKPSDKGVYAQYGHAGFVIDENDTQYKIKSSNYRGDGKITEDWVDKYLIDGAKSTDIGIEYKASLNLEDGLNNVPTGGGEDKKGIVGGTLEIGGKALDITNELINGIFAQATVAVGNAGGFVADYTVDKVMEGIYKKIGKEYDESKGLGEFLRNAGEEDRKKLLNNVGIDEETLSTKIGGVGGEIAAAIYADIYLGQMGKTTGATVALRFPKLAGYINKMSKSGKILDVKKAVDKFPALKNIFTSALKGIPMGATSEIISTGKLTKEGLITGALVDGGFAGVGEIIKGSKKLGNFLLDMASKTSKETRDILSKYPDIIKKIDDGSITLDGIRETLLKNKVDVADIAKVTNELETTFSTMKKLTNTDIIDTRKQIADKISTTAKNLEEGVSEAGGVFDKIAKQKVGINKKSVPNILDNTFKKYKIKIDGTKVDAAGSSLISSEKTKLQSVVSDIDDFINTTRGEMNVEQAQSLKRKIRAARKDANSSNLNKVFDDLILNIDKNISNVDYLNANKDYSKAISEFNKVKNKWLDSDGKLKESALSNIDGFTKDINAIKDENVRAMFNDIGGDIDKLKGLKDLDSKLPIKSDISKIKGLEGFGSEIDNKISSYNEWISTNKELDKLLGADKNNISTSLLKNRVEGSSLSKLEKLKPGITKDLEALKAIEDIEKANNTTQSLRLSVILGGISGAAFNPSTLTLSAGAVLTSPKVLKNMITGYADAKVVKNIVDKVVSAKRLTVNEYKILQQGILNYTNNKSEK